MPAGLRPFGVSILYMGWDKHYGYQLYQSDPSGNYSGWKATCIGNNSVVSHNSFSVRNCVSLQVVHCQDLKVKSSNLWPYISLVATVDLCCMNLGSNANNFP